MKKNLLTLLLLFSTILFSCKKDTPNYSINQSTLSLNFDDQHQFVIKEDGENTDASAFKWTSSDPSVGTINASGLFQGVKIGKTTIKAEGNGATLVSEITITPYTTLCKEPYLEFGATAATIKSKETRTLLQELPTSLLYRPENDKVLGLAYGLENGRLETPIFLLGENDVRLKEAITFFAERYTFQGESEDEMTIFFGDKKVLIAIGFIDDLGFYAAYFPNSLSAKASFKDTLKDLGDIKIKRQTN